MAEPIRKALSILRLSEVKKRTGLSRSSIYAKIAEGDFPSQIALGKRAIGFVEAEIDGWIAQRIERSRKPREASAKTSHVS